jgi:hypothetical protein
MVNLRAMWLLVWKVVGLIPHLVTGSRATHEQLVVQLVTADMLKQRAWGG